MYSLIQHPIVEQDLEELDHSLLILVFKKLKQLQKSPQIGLPLGNKNYCYWEKRRYGSLQKSF